MLKKLWLRTVEGRLLLNTEVDANFTDLNDAASWAATGFYGATDPSTLTKVQVEIGLVWADTASGWVKRCQQVEPSVVWKNVARLWDAALPQFSELPVTNLGDIHLIGVGPHSWDDEEEVYKPLTSPGGNTDDLQWLGTPIGVELPFHPNAPLPPTDNPNFRYIVLTAGLTGAGQYNEGVLTDETVTGSDPTITATATVSLTGSPMNGQTIDLINTSRVFLRPGPAAGAIVASQNAAHAHTGSTDSAGSHAHTLNVGDGSYGAADGLRVVSKLDMGKGNLIMSYSSGNHTHTVTINSSGGSEAHPRYIPRVYLMRIL